LKGRFSASPDLNATLLNPALVQTRLGHFQHRLGGIEGSDRTCLRRQRGRNDARPAGDVEQSAAARFAERRAEAAWIVGLRRPMIEILRLTGELVGDSLEMVHEASFRFRARRF
jgi:hypothetical protein